jgi:thiol-disulfide isomerase/thioredoxin
MESTRLVVDLPFEGQLPSLSGATGWLNSPRLEAADLRGKVVLLDFWTYTCINWLRTLPYLRAWAEKYKDYGHVVIGVHTPEFDFEHDLDNVRRAAKDLQVNYPIAIDNDYAIWDAFGNRYWPALYFVDGHGQIRHHRFGEGDYEQSEAIIQRLLTEAGSGGISHDLVAVDARGVEAAADWDSLRSPETTSATSTPRTSRRPMALSWTHRTSMPPPHCCDSTSGPLPATGRCSDRPRC